MATLWATVTPSSFREDCNVRCSTWRPVRSLLAAFLAGALAAGSASPAFAQSANQNPVANPAPPSIAPVSSLGVAGHSYRRGPSAFPNIFKPYQSQFVDRPVLTNSPRIDQLVHEGKLEISLQDAIELALENSLDIAVQRYYPWISDAGLLNADAGNTGFATPGVAIAASSAAINPFAFFIQNFDPLIQSSASVSDATTPINNPFISGAGTTSAGSIVSHSTQFNNQYSQTFHTGTNVTVSWNNTRGSANIANFFNPDVSSNLQVSISQPLLNGFGRQMWTRNIRIANNNRKIADWAFAQQAITTITNTITAYWELVYARENVKVNQQAVAVAQKLYEDNKKQLEIGSMAPLDVTRSESELATDQQNLIFAQTVQLQDEQTLKNGIAKDPLAPNLINVEIIPTDKPDSPQSIQIGPFADAVKEAFANRPDVREQIINLRNGEIDVKATKNALLPIATLSGTYYGTGLAGNAPITTTTPAAGLPIVDANGNPIDVLNSAGVAVPVFVPTASSTVTGTSRHGLPDAMSQIFHNRTIPPRSTLRFPSATAPRRRTAFTRSSHNGNWKLKCSRSKTALCWMFETPPSPWNRAARRWRRPAKPASCSSRRLTRSRRNISSALPPYTTSS
jgi:hypothetical protein